MGKYYGEIGYAITVENSPGLWEEEISTKNYYGDVFKDNRKTQSSGSVNDNLNISTIVSIIADPFAYENFQFIRYASFMNAKWKVTDVDVKYPRLNLTLGGLYNGQ